MLNNVSETTHHVATYIVNNSFLCKKFISKNYVIILLQSQIFKNLI